MWLTYIVIEAIILSGCLYVQECGISKFFKLPALAKAIAAVACVSFFVLLAGPAVGRQMDEWQLLPRPERLTELYFVDYSSLQASSGAGDARTVSFVVRNYEQQTIDYYYELSAMSENERIEHPVEKGSFTLGAGRSRATDKMISLPNLEGRISVKVSLRYKGISPGSKKSSIKTQSIHYWTTMQSAAGRAGDKREEA